MTAVLRVTAAACILAASTASAREATADWRVSVETAFQGDKPASDLVGLLLAELSNPGGPGKPVAAEEFRLLCRRADPVVYVKDILKYATPRSLKIQNQEQADYLKIFMREERLEQGARFLRQHAPRLAAAEAQFGIRREDIVSILMWESRLGEIVGNRKVFNVFLGQVLYLDAARRVAVDEIRHRGNPERIDLSLTEKERRRLDRAKQRAVENLAALVRISKEKGVDPLAFVGSWGGAIGFVQFMPQSLRFAVDGDGDGQIDLNGFPDAIFSVANYLKEHGYGPADADRRRGVFGYNRLDSYVNGVLTYADAIRARPPEVTARP